MAHLTCLRTCTVAILVGFSAWAAPIYSNFITVDGPGDNAGGTTINGISSTGALVGFSSNAAATVLTNFVRNPDGSVTVLNINNDPIANANGVNSHGIAVGTTGGQAFALDHGLLSVLPPINGSITSEVAFGINDNMSIVGQYTDSATGTTPGFVYQNGHFMVFNPVANAVATNTQGINNQGLATGFYSTDGQHQHGFLFNTATNTSRFLADPVQPNLFLTQFLGINDNGLAVGYWQDIIGSQHGFIFNINTSTYTFLDDPNEGTINGVQITQITGISDANEIAGFYVDPHGVQRGFYANANTVPEPASLGLIGLGLAGIGAAKKRKHSRA